MAARGKGRRRGGRRGTMMGMRSGFQRMTGRKKGRKKREASFWTVLGWVAAVALVMVLIWRLRAG